VAKARKAKNARLMSLCRDYVQRAYCRDLGVAQDYWRDHRVIVNLFGVYEKSYRNTRSRFGLRLS